MQWEGRCALLVYFGGSHVPAMLFTMGCALVSIYVVSRARDRSGEALDD